MKTLIKATIDRENIVHIFICIYDQKLVFVICRKTINQ